MYEPSPQGNSADRDSASEQQAESAPLIADDALDAIVRATLESADDEAHVTNEEIAALAAVARRHRLAPLSYDPVAIELVEAIIQANYGPLGRPPEVWHATAAKIAALLLESPASRARLENLWSRLVEAHGSRIDA
jgi:hypothetical protein